MQRFLALALLPAALGAALLAGCDGDDSTGGTAGTGGGDTTTSTITGTGTTTTSDTGSTSTTTGCAARCALAGCMTRFGTMRSCGTPAISSRSL